MELKAGGKSPFLLRDVLLEEAAGSEREDPELLDASRGAANWQQPLVLAAWHALGLYSAQAASRRSHDPHVALSLAPGESHLSAFDEFASRCEGAPGGLAEGCRFLQRGWDLLARTVLRGWSREEIAFRFAEAAAGRAYPEPPTLDFVQPIMARYLAPLLFGGDADLAAQFEVIACEGATTGIAQVATTLARNGLISPGDRVAMWWPTYEPLRDLVECQLGCEVVPIHRDPEAGWAAEAEDLERLIDPGVRMAVTVSPGNPVPVTTDPGSLDALQRAAEAHPDLLTLADYVYMQFLDSPVETEIARLPRNTIGVYSVSKDFGLAGMRLGVVLMHAESVAQAALWRLEGEERAAADGWYCRRAMEPAQMGLTERIIADSRGVSFTHMSGLSTPLQALICLCALYDLMEPDSHRYFQWVRGELAERIEALYRGLGIETPRWTQGPSSRYSTIIDLTDVARARGGMELAEALRSHAPWDFMTHLAREWQVILTPGESFGAGEWTVRACFPSVDAAQARELGQRVARAVQQFAGS
ncbi:MAG: aminotransferase class I/II-fold pyridoxal phosphate-dependent enzyme [Armatimonadota bacterium]|nr:aminotransferase class I/II-fold pyridoxal phosphate-dependent enzyme [Armatimonadota bacterium]